MLPVRGIPAAVFVSLLFLVTVLAGCVDSETQIPGDDAMECAEDMDTEECPDPDVLSDDGRDLRTELTIEDSVPAPKWEVGDLFGQHIYDGPDDTSGYHIDSVVIEDTGSAWVIAPNNEELARRHAYWDYPFLGDFQQEDLSTSAYGYDWSFFDFPLEHNKTWQGTITEPHPTFFWWNTYDLTFRAEYAESVDTFEGKFPGFHITGTTADDRLMFSYYYVPKIEWYDQFYWYDLTTEDPEDYRLRAISMGTGKNWTGTVYTTEEKQRVEVYNFFCPQLNQEWCRPDRTHDTWTLTEGTQVFGSVIAGAWGGHSRVTIQPPEGNTRTYEHTNTEVPDGGEPDDFDALATVTWYDEASIPGDWQFANTGGGAVWGGFVNLVEFELQELALGEA